MLCKTARSGLADKETPLQIAMQNSTNYVEGDVDSKVIMCDEEFDCIWASLSQFVHQVLRTLLLLVLPLE